MAPVSAYNKQNPISSGSPLIKPLSRNHIFLFCLLCLPFGCANSDSTQHKDTQLIKNIKQDLRLKKVVIVYRMTNKDKTSQQYADWSAYLNDFIADQKHRYAIYQADSTLNTLLIKAGVQSTDSYTLFMKNNKPSYLYDDVIVEPMVYSAVNNAYSMDKLQAGIQTRDEAFLPDEITINLLR